MEQAKRDLIKYFVLWVGLFMAAGRAELASAPRRTAKPDSIGLLIQSVRESQRQGLHQTTLRNCRTLVRHAQQARQLAPLLYAINVREQTNSELDYTYESTIQSELERLYHQPWLTAAEQALLSLYSAELYLYSWAQSSVYGYRSHASRTLLSGAVDSVVPRNWTKPQYMARMQTLMTRAFKSPTALATRHGYLDRDSVLLIAQLANVAQRAYDHNIAPIEVLRQGLGRTLSETKAPEVRLHADYAMAYINGKDAYQLEMLLERYRSLPESLNYLATHAKGWEKRLGGRGAVERIDYFMQGHSESSSTSLSQLRQSLLWPTLNLNWVDNTLLGRRDMQIRLHHRHLERIAVDVFPRAVRPLSDDAWKYQEPPTDGIPILSKSYTLTDNEQWLEESLVECISLPRTGAFVVRFTGYPRQRATSDKPIVRVQAVTVSDIFPISRLYRDSGRLYWLDAMSGAPLPERIVDVASGGRSEQLRTGRHGDVSLPHGSERSTWFRMSAPSDTVTVRFDRHFLSEHWTNPTSDQRMLLITDRPACRPGQTIQMYGYLGEVGRQIEQARTLSDHDVTLTVSTPDGYTLETAKLKTDRFGRIYMAVEIPRQGKLGRYEIRASSRKSAASPEEEESYAWFDVLEYKRPQFEVSQSTPNRPLAIGDSARIETSVRELSGSPISGATVRYTVTKREYERVWYSAPRESVEVIEMQTDLQGQTTLPIHCAATVGHEGTAMISFEVETEAIAPTGEVQHDKVMIFAGKTPLHITCELPKYIERSAGGQLLFIARDRQSQSYKQRIHFRIKSSTGIILADSCFSGDTVEMRPYVSRLNPGWYTIQYGISQGVADSVPPVDRPFFLYDKRSNQADLRELPLMLSSSRRDYTAKSLPQVFYGSGQNDSYIFCTVRMDERTVIADSLLRPQPNRLYTLDLERLFRGRALPEIVLIDMQTVRWGRMYTEHVELRRQLPAKSLTLRWETWRDRIHAGGQEEWRLRVLHDGRPITAAVASWMYDATLDMIAPGYAPRHIDTYIDPSLFVHPLEQRGHVWDNRAKLIDPFAVHPEVNPLDESEGNLAEPMMLGYSRRPLLRAASALEGKLLSAHKAVPAVAADMPQPPAMPQASIIRSDFSESAYFCPDLVTDHSGQASWVFRLPESLTRWRVEVLAHTMGLDTGHRTDYLESYRDFQVRSFLPRQLRLGDSTTMAASVRNMSEQMQAGRLQIELFDLRTDSVLYRDERSFRVERDSMQSFAFALHTPRGLDSLGVRVVGRTAEFSDGEQHRLPILADTEESVRALAMTVGGRGKQTYSLASLFPSSAYRPEVGQLDIRIESNPLYLALLSVPTTMKVDSDNAISLAAALYAHRLIRYLGRQSDLRPWLQARYATIKPSADSIRRTPGAATPYARRIELELEANRIAALLQAFEDATPEQEHVLLERLTRLQDPSSGLLCWFPGMRGNEHVSLAALRIILRSEDLVREESKVEFPASALINGLWRGIGTALLEDIKRIQANEAERRDTLPSLALPYQMLEYLYLHQISSERLPAEEQIQSFALPRLRRITYTLPLEERALAARVLATTDRSLVDTLLRSLRESLTETDEGAFFAGVGMRYWWSSRTYPTMTYAIETLAALSSERYRGTIASMQRWLLAQKRGVQWESTIGTCEVLHALMLGQSLPPAVNETTALLEFSGGKTVSWTSDRRGVSLDFDKANLPISLTLTSGLGSQVWASASARYMLPISQETPHGKQMSLRRRYYLRHGSELTELVPGTRLPIGGRLLVRLELTLTRDLDFVELRDPRLGCAEPLSSRVGYTWGGGTPYYIEPRDEETRFYFDRLNRGTYILEYEQAIVRSGDYQVPSANAQSVYAPEYTASSGYGGRVLVDR